MEFTSVIFTKNYGPYKAGQIAGFPKDQADQLVAKKLANLWYPAREAAPTRNGVKGVRK